jgi:hypothetical protein
MSKLFLIQASLRMVFIFSLSNFVFYLAVCNLPIIVHNHSLDSQTRLSFDWHIANNHVKKSGDKLDPLPWDDKKSESVRKYFDKWEVWAAYVALFGGGMVILMCTVGVYYFLATAIVICLILLCPPTSTRWLLFAPIVLPVAIFTTNLLFETIPVFLFGEPATAVNSVYGWLTPVAIEKAEFSSYVASWIIVVAQIVFACFSLFASFSICFLGNVADSK